jgi:hypothetical protein
MAAVHVLFRFEDAEAAIRRQFHAMRDQARKTT